MKNVHTSGQRDLLRGDSSSQWMWMDDSQRYHCWTDNYPGTWISKFETNFFFVCLQFFSQESFVRIFTFCSLDIVVSTRLSRCKCLALLSNDSSMAPRRKFLEKSSSRVCNPLGITNYKPVGAGRIIIRMLLLIFYFRISSDLTLSKTPPFTWQDFAKFALESLEFKQIGESSLDCLHCRVSVGLSSLEGLHWRVSVKRSSLKSLGVSL